MNFILENTFLWEVDWGPLIKFHCLITMQGHYGVLRGPAGAPLQQTFRGRLQGHATLAGHITSLRYLDVFQKWENAGLLMRRLKPFCMNTNGRCEGNM